MKKTNINPDKHDDMLPEYDFSGQKPIRGKYHQLRKKGYTVRIHNEDGTVTEKHYGPMVALDMDVAAYFPDAESVNKALRGLIALIPNKQVGEKKTGYNVRKKS